MFDRYSVQDIPAGGYLVIDSLGASKSINISIDEFNPLSKAIAIQHALNKTHTRSCCFPRIESAFVIADVSDIAMSSSTEVITDALEISDISLMDLSQNEVATFKVDFEFALNSEEVLSVLMKSPLKDKCSSREIKLISVSQYIS